VNNRLICAPLRRGIANWQYHVISEIAECARGLMRLDLAMAEL